MFVRWKEQTRKTLARHRFSPNRPEDRIPDTLYVAYLVKSVRVDGKPRQKTLYLASIRNTRMDYPNHRLHFWKSVQAKIEPLHLSIEQQHAIKATLLARVPDVTREQLRAENEEINRLTARIKA
jgi:hypothetical protein